MSIDPLGAPRALPDRPSLRHLKDQAKDLVKAGTATSITETQFEIARLYGFPSWPGLEAHVDSLSDQKTYVNTAAVHRGLSAVPRADTLPAGTKRENLGRYAASCENFVLVAA